MVGDLKFLPVVVNMPIAFIHDETGCHLINTEGPEISDALVQLDHDELIQIIAFLSRGDKSRIITAIQCLFPNHQWKRVLKAEAREAQQAAAYDAARPDERPRD